MITYEVATHLLYDRGITPPVNKEFEDYRLKALITELNAVRQRDNEICEEIRKLSKLPKA